MAEKRTYEIDFWDGIKLVYDRFDEGKRTLSDMIDFLTKRQAIEEHYAKDLVKLCGRASQTAEAGTVGTGWAAIKTDHELQQRARTQLSSTIQKDLVSELITFKREHCKAKDGLAASVQQLQNDMDKLSKALNKSKNAYHAKSGNAEQALATYEKAQQDPICPPKQLTKYNATQQKQRKEAESADAVYQNCVQDYQSFQMQYETKMKEILVEFQQMEERRLVFMKVIMDKYVAAHDALVSGAKQALHSLTGVVNNVNGLADLQDFITENTTNQQPPPPIEYVPYKNRDGSFSTTNKNFSKGGLKSDKKKKVVKNKTASSKQATKQVSNPTPTVQAKAPQPRKAAKQKKAKAMFEYTAADDTELGFSVGDVINIINIDASGWWTGSLNGKTGLFPGNYCELINENAAASTATATASAPTPIATPKTDNRKKCKVNFDFTADTPDELSIAEGEIIFIDGENEGWFTGTNSRGQSGMFPANYVELM